MTHLVLALLDAFNGSGPVEDFVTEDATLEFPYGPGIGVPGHVTGPGAARHHLDQVRRSGLRLTEPRISALVDDPDTFLVEQQGHYRIEGRDVVVPVISIITLREGRLTALREYWDTHRLAGQHSSTPPPG